MTTAVQLHLLMSVASNPQRPSGHEKPGRPGQTSDRGKSLKARRCSVQQEMQFYVISINSMMHVAGLIGTVVPADEVSKWMYWIFGCAMFAMISNQLTSTQGQIWRVAKENKVLDHFGALARTTIAVWALYPLMWAFADGSRTIQWEIKELLYILLDLWAKFSFTLVFLVTSTRDVLPHTCQVLHSNLPCSSSSPCPSPLPLPLPPGDAPAPPETPSSHTALLGIRAFASTHDSVARDLKLCHTLPDAGQLPIACIRAT